MFWPNLWKKVKKIAAKKEKTLQKFAKSAKHQKRAFLIKLEIDRIFKKGGENLDRNFERILIRRYLAMSSRYKKIRAGISGGIRQTYEQTPRNMRNLAGGI